MSEKTYKDDGKRLVNRENLDRKLEVVLTRLLDAPVFRKAVRRAVYPKWLHWLVCR